jgi:hypothetical protein
LKAYLSRIHREGFLIQPEAGQPLADFSRSRRGAEFYATLIFDFRKKSSHVIKANLIIIWFFYIFLCEASASLRLCESCPSALAERIFQREIISRLLFF